MKNKKDGESIRLQALQATDHLSLFLQYHNQDWTLWGLL